MRVDKEAINQDLMIFLLVQAIYSEDHLSDKGKIYEYTNGSIAGLFSQLHK